MLPEYLDLRCCDNMELMREFGDKHFDLAIVDPPYGINATEMNMGQNKNRSDGWSRGDSTAVRVKKGRLNSGGGKLKNRLLNTSDIGWDNNTPDTSYFELLEGVSKNRIIWGGNYFPLPPTRCVVCWDKCQPWENFSQWEMAWTSFDKPAALYRYSNTGGANKEKKIHPTQKPIDLYKWLLSKYAEPGDKILDTHLGSMSIAIAVHEMNKQGMNLTLVGCEIDSQYYADGIKRVEQACLQFGFNF